MHVRDEMDRWRSCDMSAHEAEAQVGSPAGTRTTSLPVRLVVSAALLVLTGLLARGAPLVRAQTDSLAVGSVVKVSTTDGDLLNLRSGPSADLPIGVRLSPDDTLTVLGVPQAVGATRWLPVRTASNQVGWISDQYVVPVGPP